MCLPLFRRNKVKIVPLSTEEKEAIKNIRQFIDKYIEPYINDRLSSSTTKRFEEILIENREIIETYLIDTEQYRKIIQAVYQKIKDDN